MSIINIELTYNLYTCTNKVNSICLYYIICSVIPFLFPGYYSLLLLYLLYIVIFTLLLLLFLFILLPIAYTLYLLITYILYLLIVADNTKYKGTRPACMHAGPAAPGPSMHDHNRKLFCRFAGRFPANSHNIIELFNISFVQ